MKNDILNQSKSAPSVLDTGECQVLPLIKKTSTETLL